MTAVWIILSIVLILAVLLSCSVAVTVAIKDEVRIWVGAFGIRFPLELNGEKAEKPVKRKKVKTKDADSHEDKSKPDKKSLGETVEFALMLLKSIVPSAVRLASHIRFASVRIDVTVAEDDADRTAIEYGAVSAGIYNLLATLDQLFTLRVKSVDVQPDFVSGESKYDIFFRAKLRFWNILTAAIGIFFKLIVHTMSAKKEEEKTHSPNDTISAEAE